MELKNVFVSPKNSMFFLVLDIIIYYF